MKKKKCSKGWAISEAYANLTGKGLRRWKKLTKNILTDEDGKKFRIYDIKNKKYKVKLCRK